jgi:hypothetical protein
MLQLLLERAQSYDDIASVLGVSRDEVRERARAALTELQGLEPDTRVTDYLLGQAEPAGRADVARLLQDDPEALALASSLVARLRSLAPEAELPKLPQPAVGRAESRPTTLSQGQGRSLFGLVGGAVVVLGVILVIAGVFGGGDDNVSEPEATGQGADDAIEVSLEPQGKFSARGVAVFGSATADQPFVDLSLEGLESPSAEQAYVLWFLLTPGQGYPISPFEPREDGTFSDRFPIPDFAADIARRARFIDVSLSDRAALSTQVDEFARQLGRTGQLEQPLLRYEGESVLRGELPTTGGPALQGGVG